MPFFQNLQRGVGGILDRINAASQTPAFGLGIGFLQGDPQAGLRNAAFALQAQIEQQRYREDQAARQQAAQAQAQQQAAENQFRERALALQEQALDPASVREAAFVHPDDLSAQRRFVSSMRDKRASNGVTYTMPDGTVLQVGGTPGGAGLGIKGRNDLDTRRLNTADQMQRINQIVAVYDARFLKAGEKFDNLMLTIKDKGILPGAISAEEQKSIADFSAFRQSAFNNLNATLREMSGAAITPQEAERLTKSLPNPGKGVFDGDSPTQFKTKLDTVTDQLKLAMARYNYAAATGIPYESTNIVSLDQMKDFMNKRANELETQIRAQNPGASEDDIRATVKAQLRALFGAF
jgi:hypothetical protein